MNKMSYGDENLKLFGQLEQHALWKFQLIINLIFHLYVVCAPPEFFSKFI